MKIPAASFLLIVPALISSLSGMQATPGKKNLSVQSGSVAVEKASLHYDVAGNGDALILIHGGLLTKEMWDGAFEKFAQRYRVVRYDARNHGRSRSEEATFAHFEDLRMLMDGLKIDKAVLMGLSLGSKTAIDFSLKYPNRVSGLVLVAPGLSGFKPHGPEEEAYEKKFNAAVQSGDMEKMIEAFMEAWTYGPRRSAEQVDPVVRDKIRDMARITVKTWNSQTKELILSPPAIIRLADIKVPTLAVVGDIDMPNILEIVALLEKSIPHFQKVVIPGTAHMVNLEKPQEFDRAVQPFLDAVYTKSRK
jgi:3-oxoadipate enol-lactonase